MAISSPPPRLHDNSHVKFQCAVVELSNAPITHRCDKASHVDVQLVKETLEAIADCDSLSSTSGSPRASELPPQPLAICNGAPPPRTPAAVFKDVRELTTACRSDDEDSVEDVVRSESSYGLEPVVALRRAQTLADCLGELMSGPSPQNTPQRARRPPYSPAQPPPPSVPAKRQRAAPARQPSQPPPPCGTIVTATPAGDTSAMSEALALASAMNSEACPAGVGAQSRAAVANGAPKKGQKAPKAMKIASIDDHKLKKVIKPKKAIKRKVMKAMKAMKAMRRTDGTLDFDWTPTPAVVAEANADMADIRKRVLAGLDHMVAELGDEGASPEPPSVCPGDVVVLVGADAAAAAPRRKRGTPAGDIGLAAAVDTIAAKACTEDPPMCSKTKD